MADEKKVEMMQLEPPELAAYQQFFMNEAQVFTQMGKVTAEYRSAMAQGEGVLKQIYQMREQWIVRLLAKRGLNPAMGNWQIDPQTGHIINMQKVDPTQSKVIIPGQG